MQLHLLGREGHGQRALQRRPRRHMPGFGRCESRFRFGWCLAVVKIGQQRTQLVNVCAGQRSGLQLFGKQRTFGEVPHVHRVFQRRAAAVQHWRLRGAGDARQVQVQRRREPAVQPQFLLAKMPARLQRGVVDKRQSNRFFELVGTVARQQHPGNMGFDQVGAQLCGKGADQGPGWVKGRNIAHGLKVSTCPELQACDDGASISPTAGANPFCSYAGLRVFRQGLQMLPGKSRLVCDASVEDSNHHEVLVRVVKKKPADLQSCCHLKMHCPVFF